MRRSPFRIAAPWSPCLSFYVNIAGGGGVGRQPLSRKSRVREFMLALRPFNLRMQALRRPRTSLLPFVITGIPNTSFRASYRHNLDTRYSSRPGSQMCKNPSSDRPLVRRSRANAARAGNPYRDRLLTLKKHNCCGIDAPSSANKLGSQPIN